MRPVKAPSPIALASSARLSAVDGNGTPSLGGRLTSLIDLLPLLGSRDSVRYYHAVDVIVTGGNPLLAALALRAAARDGLRAAVAPGAGDDAWPYDLAATDDVARVLATSLGMEIPGSGQDSLMERLMTRILADVPRTYPLVAHHLSQGSRPAGADGVFFMGDELAPWRPVDPFHLRMSSVFGRFMKGRTTLGKASRGRTVVFARLLLLTSRPKAFGDSRTGGGMVSWDGAVRGVGSARWDVPSYPAAARGMLEDIFKLSRGL